MTMFLHQVPAAPLDRFVKMIWYWQGARPSHTKDRMMPDGTIALIINLREDQCRIYDREDPSRCRTMRGITVSGPHSEYFFIDTAEQDCVLGAEFKPGGAFPFLGPPPSELHGMHLSLEDLWGRAATELRDQVLEAPTPSEKLHALEAALLRRLRGDVDPHPAVRFALDRFHTTPNAVSVAKVTEAIGLSPRRFIQLFREQVGLNPKLYCRVRRFQEAIRAARSNGRIEWTTVALDAGYFDQAHFIHDFRAFAGISPGVYLASGPNGNHVPVDGA